jgi:hypothetical protein
LKSFPITDYVYKLFILLICSFMLISSVELPKEPLIPHEEICRDLGKIKPTHPIYSKFNKLINQRGRFLILSPSNEKVIFPLELATSIEFSKLETKRKAFFKLYFKSCGTYPNDLTFLKNSKSISHKRFLLLEKINQLNQESSNNEDQITFLGKIQTIKKGKIYLQGIIWSSNSKNSQEIQGYLNDYNTNSELIQNKIYQISNLKISSIQIIETTPGNFSPIVEFKKLKATNHKNKSNLEKLKTLKMKLQSLNHLYMD